MVNYLITTHNKIIIIEARFTAIAIIGTFGYSIYLIQDINLNVNSCSNKQY